MMKRKQQIKKINEVWGVYLCYKRIVPPIKNRGGGGPLHTDSNFSKKTNDEIFRVIFCLSVHLRADMKFCSKIVKHIKKMDPPPTFQRGGPTVLNKNGNPRAHLNKK